MLQILSSERSSKNVKKYVSYIYKPPEPGNAVFPGQGPGKGPPARATPLPLIALAVCRAPSAVAAPPGRLPVLMLKGNSEKLHKCVQGEREGESFGSPPHFLILSAIRFLFLLFSSPLRVTPRCCRRSAGSAGHRRADGRPLGGERLPLAWSAVRPLPGRPPRLPAPGTAPPRPCPARRLPALPDLPPLPPGAAPSGAPPPAPLLPSRQLHGRGGRRPSPGGARGALPPRRARPGPGLFVPRLGGAGLARAPRHRALPAGAAPPPLRPPGGAGRPRARRLRPGRTRRGGWRRSALKGGSGDAAGQGAQSLPPRPRGKEFAKAAPFPPSPSARAGAALREGGTGPPAPGRNGALCSPVKASAVPELREKVSTTQKKSLFYDLLSSAPAASYPALKTCWKHGVAVYLGYEEYLFQHFHRRS